MASGFDPMAWLTAIPGVIALLGGAVGVGAIHQRVRNLEDDIKDMSALKGDVARIDERTKSAADKLESVDRKIDTVIATMLDGRGQGRARRVAVGSD